jgi:WD40 repeat protein
METMLEPMLGAKLKRAAAVLMAAFVAAGGTGFAIPRAVAAKPGDDTSLEQPFAEGREDPQTKPEGKKLARTDMYGDPLPDGALARLGTMRFRHGKGANLAFAPDGKSLLTCGADRTIRTWDAVTGRLLKEQNLPAGHASMGPTVLSSDGRLLAFQDFYTMDVVYLWDVARNQLRHRLPLGERCWIRDIFSPDGKTLVTAEQSGLLNAWDVVTGESRLLGKHKRDLLSLSFTADGTLVTKSWDPNVYFWDLKAGREQSRKTIPENIVGAVATPNGRTIAVWTWHNEDKDNGLQFWDADAGKPANGWIAPNQKRIRGVQFAPDSKTVLIGTEAGILIWDPLVGKKVRLLEGGSGQNVTLSPDGKTIAELGPGNVDDPCGTVVRVWDLATGVPRAANAAEHGHLGEVDGLALAPDGRTIASSSGGDHSVRLWEATTGRLLRSLPVKEELTFHSLVFTPDGNSLLAGTSAAILRWDVATGQEIRRYPLFEAGKEDRRHLTLMHLTDDGRTLLAVSQNLDRKGAARVGQAFGKTEDLQSWDVATGKRLRSGPILTEDFWVGYGRFSADGRRLALPGGSIRDAVTGKEITRLSVEGKSLGTPVAFSPDGAFMAEGVWQEINRSNIIYGREMTGVQVWELATLLPVARLETGGLADLAFTPDGGRVITAGREALKLWDVASGELIASRPAPGHFRGSFGDSFASTLVLAPNGRTVATGHTDSTILLWDLASPTAPHPPRLTGEQQDALWTDLGGEDAGRALTALAHLTEAPEQTVALLRDRLRPAKTPPAEELRLLLADLDDAEFARREKATKRLADFGDLADAALHQALENQPSLEARRRMERLLAEPRLVRTPEARRHLRAIRILEQIASPQARQVLQNLATGAADVRLTREAKASLERLERK